MLNSTKLVEYIRSKDSGWIYNLRVLRYRFLRWLYSQRVFLLSKFTKKRNMVIATAYSGRMYGDNPQYVIDKIHELSSDTEIVWLCSDTSDNTIPSYVHRIDINDKKKVAECLSEAMIIIGNNSYFDNYIRQSDQLHIQTWHGGLGIKKIGVDSSSTYDYQLKALNRAYDFWISNSDHLTKVYRTAFDYKGPVWKSGYPIEDELTIDRYERAFFRRKYGVSEETHVVLYAPTFRSEYSWQCKMDATGVLEALEKRFGGKWVMWVHWHHLTKPEDRVLNGALDVTDELIMQKLVKASDAFISDYSSSIFQAVQCNIPCFIYADDYENYDVKRGLYLPLDRQPFPYALNNIELVNNIIDYDSDVWKEKWKLYADRMGHVVTGHSADDIAKVCVDFLSGKSKEEIMKDIPFEECT